MTERPTDVMRRSRRQNIDSVLQFPSNLGAHSMMLVFNKYKYVPPGDPERQLNKVDESTYTAQQLAGKDTILLPLPANLRDSYNVRVQGYEAGLGGAAVGTIASELTNTADLNLKTLLSRGGGLLRRLGLETDDMSSGGATGLGAAAAFIGRKSIDTFTPNGGRAVDSGLGNLVNPKASLYFDGMNLKQHDFQWTLAPMKETESDTIRKISETIKRNVLPSYATALGFKRVLLNYPSTVDIFFFGIDQNYFVHYKTCMVQSFNTEFTPQGQAILKGGKPAVQTISLQMIETDIHTSEDYGGSSVTEGLTDMSIQTHTPTIPQSGPR